MSVYKWERCPRCKYKHKEPDPKENQPCPKCGTMMRFAKNWTAEYQLNYQKRTIRGSPRKKFTEDALSKKKVEIREGTVFEVRPETPWATAVEKFKKDGMNDISRNTKLMYLNSLKALDPFFKHFTLDKIRLGDVDAYVSDRGTHSRNGTVNRDLATLKRLFNLSLDWDFVAPSKHVSRILKRKKLTEKPRIRFLMEEEVGKLLEHCHTPHLRLAVLIAVNTGLRISGIVGMRWSDVKGSLGIIRRQVKGGKEVSIPLTAQLRDELEQYRKQYPTVSRFIFPSQRGGKILDVKKPLRRDHAIGFRTACDAAGIEDFRFHDLRHTFATWFLARTGELATLQEILGHSSIEQTRKYAHVLDEHKRKAMLKFER